jgi:hypothetical protein
MPAAQLIHYKLPSSDTSTMLRSMMKSYQIVARHHPTYPRCNDITCALPYWCPLQLSSLGIPTMMWFVAEPSRAMPLSYIFATHRHYMFARTDTRLKLPSFGIMTMRWCAVESSRTTSQFYTPATHTHHTVRYSVAPLKLPSLGIRAVIWCAVESSRAMTPSHIPATHGLIMYPPTIPPSKLPLWRVATVVWCAVDSSRATLLSDLAKPDTSSLHCPMCPYRYHIHALIVFH